MREILFRGKRIDNGEWVEGGILQEKEYVAITVFSDYHGWHEFVEVIPETIGQYTGLTDKNGKKIFEGDICKVCRSPDICVGQVEYYERIASFIVKVSKTDMLVFLDYMSARQKVGDRVWIEVVGNICDNPELLGGVENG